MPSLAHDSDLAILLKAMGSYQDKVREEHPDRASYPAMVNHDWEFHQAATGFDRAKIARLLPQLVSAGLAHDMASKSRHRGNPSEMGPEDGFAWISDFGQLQLSQMRQPPPALPVMLTALGPVAEAQLSNLLRQAAESGVSKNDICRLEDLLKDLVDANEESKLEKAATIVDMLQGSKELAAFLLVTVLPFLASVVSR
ncbi:MAG: hypothetical protein WBA46_17105 [Thermomicrobiales bacterium]